MCSVRHKMFYCQRVFPVFLRFLNTDFAMEIARALRRYVLLYCCIIECLVSEASGGNEVSKVNITHGTKQSRKRRFLVYPDNGSYAEVLMTALGILRFPKCLQCTALQRRCSIQLMK
jgi:hypothetical protein